MRIILNLKSLHSRSAWALFRPSSILVSGLAATLILSLISPMLLTRRSIVSAEPTVTVQPKLGPLQGGSNADDPAIWIHPTDPTRSLMFLSDKDAGIYVFDFSGKQLQHVSFNTRLNNIDVRKGFKFGDEVIDIVAGNLRTTGKLAVLRINPDHNGSNPLTLLSGPDSSGNDIASNSYGFTLYRRPSDGSVYAFDKPKGSDSIRQYLVSGSGGQISVTQVREIKDVNIGVAEGFVADDELGFVYFAEEGKGIHKYQADPDSGNLNRLAFFASSDGISGDREGLALYACASGDGYLVLSSQGNSTLKVYDRQGNNAFRKTFTAQGSRGTDGLDVSAFPAPGFPNGFAVIHDDPGSQYYLYDWAEIAGSDLIVCTDGGQGSAGSFVDVPSDHWAYDYIETVFKLGYVAGCSSEPLMYCPDQTMTRAESAVFVERGIWGSDYIPTQPTEQTFADVALWEWFSNWADGLRNDGYTAGCGTNPLIYCPLQAHSMAEGAVFYLRMLNGPTFTPPSPSGIFADVSLSEWYAPWVEAAYNDGIYPACQTDPEIRACPTAPLTRAMGAFMMVQAKGLTTQ